MANLITGRQLTKSYGGRALFSGLSISFEENQRTGLIGPNGAGKSTLLRILAGLDEADEGELHIRRGLRVSYVPQEEPFAPTATVGDSLLAALEDSTLDEHERHTRVTILAHQMDFADEAQTVGELSGGWRKRLSIACGLIQEPDLLLLDEPTNHLDVAGVLWLEELLRGMRCPFVVVTHDRYFLENIVTRMIELSPAYPEGCYGVAGGYSKFLEKREEFLAGQRTTQAAMASRARREIAFLDSNSKAQRTKSKARIEDAHALLSDLRDVTARNNLNLAAGIDFDASGRQSRKLLAAKQISKRFGQRVLFQGVDIFLGPGVRLGLLGANGSGKSTLIRVLTGDLPPDAGEVQVAPHLKIVLFDQKREALPRQAPLREALAGKLDFVEFRGQRIHVHGWAERFLFRSHQLNTAVGELSGGEQARILIARLMLKPADVLILDEPTNDLDIASLDVLEESLTNFPGAVILVTHDRYMLDRVCNEMVALLGNGRTGRFGSVADWEAALKRIAKEGDPVAAGGSPAGDREGDPGAPGDPSTGNRESPQQASRVKPAKLSFKEQKEFDKLEAAIATAETRVAECRRQVEDPRIAANRVRMAEACTGLDAAQAEVERLYARWHALEQKQAGG